MQVAKIRGVPKIGGVPERKKRIGASCRNCMGEEREDFEII